MPHVAPASIPRGTARRIAPSLIALTASLLLGACASGGGNPLLSNAADAPAKLATADADVPQSELQKATTYWGKQAAENPQDPRAALNYAKNLKAMGAKREAMTILQEAHRYNPSDRQINSEYGRLALEHDQLTVAQKLLEHADDPVTPDWRVISARGTVLAKMGKHSEAIGFFERARQVAPDQPSVLNNLAMAHAMNGQADKAENLLRQASQQGDADPRVQQNLALVLGLQGKHDEAKVLGADHVTPDASAHNANLVRQMVQSNEPVETVAVPPVAAAKPASAPSKAANAKSAKLSTASVSTPTKGKKGKGADEPAEVDAAELVRRLADGDSAPKTR